MKISQKTMKNEGYFLEVDVQYPEKLHERHNDLPFLPERMKIEKVEMLIANLHDKTEYVIHIKKYKTIIKLCIRFKKLKAWLNSYIDIDIDKKKQKMILKKIFLS